MTPSSKPPRPATLLLALSFLTTACASTRHATLTTATTASPPPRSAACAVWSAIDYSAKRDTPETVRQIVAVNAAHDKLCPPS